MNTLFLFELKQKNATFPNLEDNVFDQGGTKQTIKY